MLKKQTYLKPNSLPPSWQVSFFSSYASRCSFLCLLVGNCPFLLGVLFSHAPNPINQVMKFCQFYLLNVYFNLPFLHTHCLYHHLSLVQKFLSRSPISGPGPVAQAQERDFLASLSSLSSLRVCAVPTAPLLEIF